MMQQGWSQWTGRAVVIAQDNIDTDQIYPGRFLSLTDRAQMAPAFFADWRFDCNGHRRSDSPFDGGQTILVAGTNFGCGSSREHAVWVMRDHGYRAVLARSFAPIFKRNAIENGIAPIEISEADYQLMTEYPEINLQITIDLAMKQVLLFSKWPLVLQLFQFSLDSFDVFCLRNATDSLGFLLSTSEQKREFLLSKERRNSLDAYFSKGDSL